MRDKGHPPVPELTDDFQNGTKGLELLPLSAFIKNQSPALPTDTHVFHVFLIGPVSHREIA